MVSGSNGQRSRRQGKENHDLRQIKQVVERRHLEKMEGGRKSKN
jgi:hypothetical protein